MPLPRRALLAAPFATPLAVRHAPGHDPAGEPAGGPARAAVPHAVRTDIYLVEGRTRREVQASIRARGPGGEGGKTYAGRTEWRVDWASATLAAPGGVTLRGFDVFVQVRHTLPRWDRPAVVGAGTVRAWDRYLAALTAHERGHAEIGLDAAAAMLAALTPALAAPPAAGATPPPAAWTEPTAAALAARLDARCERILEVARAKELDYDRVTAHGLRKPPAGWGE